MEYMILELKISSARDLKNVNLVSKMDVYAVVSLSGDPKHPQKARTPVDRDGGTNPTWNFPVKFNLDPSLLHQNRYTLEIKLRNKGTLAGDKDVGEVIVPVKELLDQPGDGKSFQHVSYQVRKPSGKPKGDLSFSYKFGEKVVAAPVPAPPPAVSKGEPVVAYPPPPAAGSTSAPYPAYPPTPPQYAAGYGYPPQPYGGYPQSQTGYGYPPPQQRYGYPQQPGYGYPPQPGYGYPPEPGYGYPQAQRPGKNNFGLGLGAGLLGGALGGLLIGDMISDAGAYDAGYDGGFGGGGGFDGGF